MSQTETVQQTNSDEPKNSCSTSNNLAQVAPQLQAQQSETKVKKGRLGSFLYVGQNK
jgi:hypothetical protein